MIAHEGILLWTALGFVTWLCGGFYLLALSKVTDALAMVSYDTRWGTPAFIAMVLVWPITLVAWGLFILCCLLQAQGWSFKPAVRDRVRKDKAMRKSKQQAKDLRAFLEAYTAELQSLQSEDREAQSMHALLSLLDSAYQQAIHAAILHTPDELGRVGKNCAFSEETLLKFRRRIALNPEHDVPLYSKGTL